MAFISSLLLARILLIELQADIRKKLYEEKRNALEMRNLDVAALQNHHERLIVEAVNKWKLKLNKLSLPGRKVRKALMPQLLTWINRPYGRLTYRMTQLITGQGCFAACLHMIGKLPTSSCGFCGIGTDNAQHTLQECTAWDVERDLLKDTIREDLSLRTVINKVLQSKENFKIS